MIYASVLQGFTGRAVMVEVDLKKGIPSTIISGLPRGALCESIDRIRASIRNSGYTYPYERILVNLSPAGILKSGTAFDLAIAAAILEKCNILYSGSLKVLAMGELQLSGHLLPSDGLLNAVLSLKNFMDLIIIPVNSIKKLFPDDHTIIEAHSLLDAVTIINNFDFNKSKPLEMNMRGDGSPIKEDIKQSLNKSTVADSSDVDNIRSNAYFIDYKQSEQFIAKCCLNQRIVAAAAISALSDMHTLLYGPPGTGKSYCGQLIYAFKQKLNRKDAFDISKIHSAAGLYGEDGLIETPPFRQPHHSASVEGMVGGRSGSPGEVSLAHKGVLFIDEAPEFKPSILQALREPLETGVISLSRVGEKWRYPADFQAIFSTNLCGCGHYGGNGICICSVREIVRYWNRIGGALFDRISIRIPFHRTAPIDYGDQFPQIFKRIKLNLAQFSQSVLSGKSLRKLTPFEVDSGLFRNNEYQYDSEKNFSLRRELDLARLSLLISKLRSHASLHCDDETAAIMLMSGGQSPMDNESIEDFHFLDEIFEILSH